MLTAHTIGSKSSKSDIFLVLINTLCHYYFLESVIGIESVREKFWSSAKPPGKFRQVTNHHFLKLAFFTKQGSCCKERNEVLDFLPLWVSLLREFSVLFLPGKSKPDRIAIVVRPGHVKMGTGYADVAQGLDPVEG